MNYKELLTMSKIEYKGLIINKNFDNRQVHYYQVTINNAIFDYFMGIGNAANSCTLSEVLHCLFLDAQLAEDDFEDFCANLGYNEDSIKALDIYKDVQRNTKKLKRALGDSYRKIEMQIEKLGL